MKLKPSTPVGHSRRTKLLASSLTLAMAAMCANSALAVNYYWDTNSTTAGFGTASGTWGTDSFWNTDSTGAAGGTFNLQSAFASGDVAIFGNGTGTPLAAGTITVNGTVSLNSAGSYATVMQWNAGTGSIILTGGKIDFTGGTAIILNSSGNLQTINSDIGLTSTREFRAGTGGYAIGGVISGAGTVVWRDGVTTLSGTSNTYSAQNQISANGTLRVASMASSTIGTNTTIRLGGSGGNGTLVYTGAGETTDRGFTVDSGTSNLDGIIDQSGTGLLKITGNIINGNTGTAVHKITLQGSTTGTGEVSGNITNGSGTGGMSVVKAGTGTWTLSGTNTYTGTTAVNAGTLSVTGSLTATSAVSVASGATLLGTGTIGGATSLASGSFVGAGSAANTIGTLTFSNTLTAVSGATFSFNLNSASGLSDLITSSSSIALGSATLALTDLTDTNAWSGTSSFSILHGSSLTGTFLGLADGDSVIVGANTYRINYTSTDVTLTFLSSTAVPEPSAFAAIFGLAALGFTASRRRRTTV